MGISGRFFVDKLMELRNILGFENNFSILLGNNIMYEDLTDHVNFMLGQISSFGKSFQSHLNEQKVAVVEVSISMSWKKREAETFSFFLEEEG